MKNSNVHIRILIYGSLAVFSVWLFFGTLDLKIPLERWGQFGDKFGALNCLFTALAFVGLLAALWHEKEQNKDREKEHNEMVTEMRKSQCETRLAARIHAIEILMKNERLEHDSYDSQGLYVDHGSDKAIPGSEFQAVHQARIDRYKRELEEIAKVSF